MPGSPKARLVWDATTGGGVPTELQNVRPTITITLPEGWELVSRPSFCEDVNGTVCERYGAQYHPSNLQRLIFNGFEIVNGAEVVYGAYVRKTSPNDSSLQCNRGCIYSEGDPAKPRCWRGACPANEPNCKDGIENGNNGCRYAGNDCANIPKQEVDCSSGVPIGGGPITTVAPSKSPITVQCTRPCIYSDQGKCWEGRCRSDSMKCGAGIAKANIGCSYAGDACGVRQEVDCKDGKPVVVKPTVSVTVIAQMPAGGTDKVEYQLFVEDPSLPRDPFYSLYRGPLVKLIPGQNKKTYTVDNLVAGKEYIVSLDVGMNGIFGNRSYFKTQITGCTRTTGVDNSKGHACFITLTSAEQRNMTITMDPIGLPTTVPTTSPELTRRPTTEPTVVPPSKTPRPTVTTPPSPEPTPEPCKHIRGDVNAPWKFVFLAAGYENNTEGLKLFEEDAVTASRAFTITNAPRLSDKISYKLNPDLVTHRDICSSGPGPNDVLCLKFKKTIKIRFVNHLNSDVLTSVQECAGDAKAYPILIVNSTSVAFSTGITIKTIPRFISGNTTHDDWTSYGIILAGRAKTNDHLSKTLAHELGHFIGNLSDEYSKGEIAEPEILRDGNCRKLNIDTSCPFRNKTCIQVCSRSDYYRSSELSVMNSSRTITDGITEKLNPASKILNEISLEILNDRIDKAPTFSFGLSQLTATEYYHNTLAAAFSVDKNGRVSVSEVRLMPVYPEPEERFESGDYYVIKLLTSTNDVLYETHRLKQMMNVHAPDTEISLNGFTLYAPYNPEASSIVFASSDGKELARANLADYNLPMPTKFSSEVLCGNNVCDVGAGEDALSCQMDCGAHLKQSEPERVDFVQDGVINGQDMAHIISDDVYLKTQGADVNGDNRTNAIDVSVLLKWFGYEL